jgi:hypothetical protein
VTIDLEDLGPVEYLVVDIAPGVAHLERSLAMELSRLVEAELIRVHVAVVLAKDDQGVVTASAPSGPALLDERRTGDEQLAELRSLGDLDLDLDRVADDLAPGATAGVVVWENTWAAPFASAARAQLVASGRVSPLAPIHNNPAGHPCPPLEQR